MAPAQRSAEYPFTIERNRKEEELISPEASMEQKVPGAGPERGVGVWGPCRGQALARRRR